jgi:hypothetical protein
VFRCFRDGFDGAAGHWLGGDGLAQSLWFAVPVVGLIGIGLILKCRLPFAIASHLALLYSGLLVYDIGAPGGAAAMFGLSANVLWAPSSLLAIPIFFASLVSSATSHRIYWREIHSSAHGGGAVVSYTIGRTALAQRAP